MSDVLARPVYDANCKNHADTYKEYLSCVLHYNKSVMGLSRARARFGDSTRSCFCKGVAANNSGHNTEHVAGLNSDMAIVEDVQAEGGPARGSGWQQQPRVVVSGQLPRGPNYERNKSNREKVKLNKKNGDFERSRGLNDDIAAVKLLREKECLEINRLYREKQEIQTQILKQTAQAQADKIIANKKISDTYLDIQQLRVEELKDKKERYSINGSILDEKRKKKEEAMRNEDWRDNVEGVPEIQSSVNTSSSYNSISAGSSVSQRSNKRPYVSRVSPERLLNTAREFGCLPIDLIYAALAYIELIKVRKMLNKDDDKYKRLVEMTKFRAVNMHGSDDYNFDCI